MGLRFDPMGGGQFKQAVNAIVEAERQPVKTMQARKKIEEDRLKLFSEFKSKVSTLQAGVNNVLGINKFKELKAELGNGKDLMEVTLDKEKASIGSWEIEIKEVAQRASMVSNGFSDPKEKLLGLGYITLELENGENQDLYVTQDDASLDSIANKINGTPGAAVKATVVKDMTDPDRPYRLIVTSKKDGAANDIRFPQLYFVDGDEDFYIEEDKGSQNALIELDGFPVELESNQLGNFMNGVGVNIKAAKPGEKFTLSIQADNKKITDKVKKVVDDANAVLEFINKQNAVDEKTDTRSTFAGDTGLQNIEFRLRNLMHEAFPVNLGDEGEFRTIEMHALGVSFDKAGKITLNEEKFTKALEKDYEGVAQVFSNEEGFAAQLKTVLDGYTTPGQGMLSMREKTIKDRIGQIDRNIENKERLIDAKQKALTEQFSRLQGSLMRLQQQQQYMTATLGGGGSNPISQLLGG